MASKKFAYHIFISYRREDGKDIARMIKESLVHKGYRVFLDMDELQDGVFDQRIINAIDSAPIYMIIMSSKCFDRCSYPNDWVRQEIEHAIAHGKIIIPINPDKQFVDYPDNMPDHIRHTLSSHQYSAIDTGQLYQVSIDKLVKERIRPTLAQLQRPRWIKWVIGLICILAFAAAGIYTWKEAIPNYYITQGDKYMLPDQDYIIHYDSALLYYKKALRLGYSKAYAKCGDVYEGLQTKLEHKAYNDWVAYEDTAVQYYRQGAYAGDAYAQVILAQRLASQGFSTWTNHDSAFYWATQAYETGHPKAPGVLGYLYRKGFGVTQDAKIAERYFREGIELNDTYSRTSLGDMLRYGRGLPKNYAEGTRLLVESMNDDDFAAIIQLTGIDTWIDQPKVNHTTDGNVSIEAFEWDKQGVLRVYLKWHNKEHPNGYMQIDTSAYIYDTQTGIRYKVKGLINCKHSPEQTSVPLGNTHHFALMFGEVPQTISMVNLCESDTSDWKFIGVDLSQRTHITTTTEFFLKDLDLEE